MATAWCRAVGTALWWRGKQAAVGNCAASRHTMGPSWMRPGALTAVVWRPVARTVWWLCWMWTVGLLSHVEATMWAPLQAFLGLPWARSIHVDRQLGPGPRLVAVAVAVAVAMAMAVVVAVAAAEVVAVAVAVAVAAAAVVLVGMVVFAVAAAAAVEVVVMVAVP
jgi:hypothetical protein